jgi:hypothetical protein
LAQLRISEEELARDVHLVLDKVERGEEIVVERDARGFLCPSRGA